MGSGGSLGRIAARGAVFLGVAVLGLGVAYAPNGDDGPTPASTADVSALTDPDYGRTFALTFGDSYFTGSDGVRPAQTFGRIALNALGYTVSVRGHGGTGYVTSSAIDGAPNYRQQIEGDALAGVNSQQIKVVVLEGGINDAIAKAKPARVQANAFRVMGDLRASFPNAIHVVLGVTADATGMVKGARLAVTRAIRRAAVIARWRYVDATSLITTKTVAAIIGRDRLHPTVAGHRTMAALLQRELLTAGVPSVSGPAG